MVHINRSQFTKFQMLTLLTDREPRVTIDGADGVPVTGILQGVSREDGSGRSFILNIRTDMTVVPVWVRTID